MSALTLLERIGVDKLDTAWMDQSACVGIRRFTELPVEVQQDVCWDGPCPVREECEAMGQHLAVTNRAGWRHCDAVYGGWTPGQIMARVRAATPEAADLVDAKPSKWTAADDLIVAEAWKRGRSMRDVAVELGRTRAAVDARIRRLREQGAM